MVNLKNSSSKTSNSECKGNQKILITLYISIFFYAFFSDLARLQFFLLIVL